MGDAREDEGRRGDLAFGTTPRLVALAAAAFGDAPFVEDGPARVTFAELPSRVREVARALLARGVGPGDRVAVWAPNRLEWVLAALGVHAAGGVLVPINTRFKGHEARYVLAQSRARVLFTVGSFLGADYPAMLRDDTGGATLDPALDLVLLDGDERPGALAWGAFLAGGAAIDDATADARAAAVRPDDLSDLIFTSGTTGHPKGVMCTHGQTLRAFRDWADVVGLRAGDRYLVVLPFFHSFGYKAGWLACLMMGATVLPQAVFDVPEVLARVARDRVSVLPGPPALYQSILAHPGRAAFDLGNLRLAVTGAAAIPVDLVRRMKGELGFDTVITGYGLTEATGVSAMCREGDDAETIATTSGRAIPGVEIRVVDDDGAEVARGETGELCVRGYAVMKGYFADEAATRAAIDAEGFLHTGDVGTMDTRGYVRITDRKKDMFIVGGLNAYPAEIEGVLLAHEDVARVAVVGMPDERLGEVGCAFVVPRAGLAPTAEALIAFCRARMANYKVPRRVEIVADLPANATGKVLKYVLRDRAKGLA